MVAGGGRVAAGGGGGRCTANAAREFYERFSVKWSLKCSGPYIKVDFCQKYRDQCTQIILAKELRKTA